MDQEWLDSPIEIDNYIKDFADFLIALKKLESSRKSTEFGVLRTDILTHYDFPDKEDVKTKISIFDMVMTRKQEILDNEVETKILTWKNKHRDSLLDPHLKKYYDTLGKNSLIEALRECYNEENNSDICKFWGMVRNLGVHMIEVAKGITKHHYVELEPASILQLIIILEWNERDWIDMFKCGMRDVKDHPKCRDKDLWQEELDRLEKKIETYKTDYQIKNTSKLQILKRLQKGRDGWGDPDRHYIEPDAKKGHGKKTRALRLLDDYLHQDETNLVITIEGLGGIGKTELCRQFIQKNLDPHITELDTQAFDEIAFISSKSDEKQGQFTMDPDKYKPGDNHHNLNPTDDHGGARIHVEDWELSWLIENICAMAWPEDGGRKSREDAIEILENNRWLIILDNFEDATKKAKQDIDDFFGDLSTRKTKSRFIITERPNTTDMDNTKKMEIEPLTVEQSSRLMSNRFVFESRKNPNQLRGEKVTWALEGLNNTKILQKILLNLISIEDDFKKVIDHPKLLFFLTANFARRLWERGEEEIEMVDQLDDDAYLHQIEKFLLKVVNDDRDMLSAYKEDVYEWLTKKAYSEVENNPEYLAILKVINDAEPTRLNRQEITESLRVHPDVDHTETENNLRDLERFGLFVYKDEKDCYSLASLAKIALKTLIEEKSQSIKVTERDKETSSQFVNKIRYSLNNLEGSTRNILEELKQWVAQEKLLSRKAIESRTIENGLLCVQEVLKYQHKITNFSELELNLNKIVNILLNLIDKNIRDPNKRIIARKIERDTTQTEDALKVYFKTLNLLVDIETDETITSIVRNFILDEKETMLKLFDIGSHMDKILKQEIWKCIMKLNKLDNKNELVDQCIFILLLSIMKCNGITSEEYNRLIHEEDCEWLPVMIKKLQSNQIYEIVTSNNLISVGLTNLINVDSSCQKSNAFDWEIYEIKRAVGLEHIQNWEDVPKKYLYSIVPPITEEMFLENGVISRGFYRFYDYHGIPIEREKLTHFIDEPMSFTISKTEIGCTHLRSISQESISGYYDTVKDYRSQKSSEYSASILREYGEDLENEIRILFANSSTSNKIRSSSIGNMFRDKHNTGIKQAIETHGFTGNMTVFIHEKMVKEWNMFEGRIRCGLGTTRLLDNWDTDEWTVHLPNFIHTPNYDKDANLGFPKEPSRYLIVEAFVKNWFENRENPSNNWIKEGKRIGRHVQSRLEELFTPDIVRTTIAKQIISSCKIITQQIIKSQNLDDFSREMIKQHMKKAGEDAIWLICLESDVKCYKPAIKYVNKYVDDLFKDLDLPLKYENIHDNMVREMERVISSSKGKNKHTVSQNKNDKSLNKATDSENSEGWHCLRATIETVRNMRNDRELRVFFQMKYREKHKNKHPERKWDRAIMKTKAYMSKYSGMDGKRMADSWAEEFKNEQDLFD